MTPPGPAELVDGALHGDKDSDSLEGAEALSKDLTAGPEPSTTTVIQSTTKETSGQSTTTTETVTHVGAGNVEADFDKDGRSIHIRPIPARGMSASKIRTTRQHTFEPRISHFDRYNPKSQADPFRGFYTLFWILVTVGMVRAGLAGYRQTGVPYRLGFARLMSEDALALALSDAAMVTVTFLSLPFAILIEKGFIPYRPYGLVIQHVGQTVFLATAIRWTFHRHWPWVQSGFMTLHTLTMLMKTHSYLSLNGTLSIKRRQLAKLSDRLDQRIKIKGGLETCLSAARDNWTRESKSDSAQSTANGHGSATHLSESHASSSSANSLRRRKSPARPAPPPKTSSMDSDSDARPLSSLKSRAMARTASDRPANEFEILTWHPDEALSKMADQACELEGALTSAGPQRNVYPQNLTLANYFDYLLVPTLVYELEYPREDKIRPLYILEKIAATFGTLSVLILITEHFILPISPNMSQHSFFGAALDLAIPFMICYLLIFYIIFECICNAFAEITRFADRQFYQDWWNSTSFDEFSRRWNVPVHAFLLRHVYNSTRSEYKLSKFQAAFTTFLLSACVHELVMAVVTKKLRLYLFAMQMAQLPLIIVGRISFFRRYPALGNLFFWLGLMAGFPMLAVAYIRM